MTSLRMDLFNCGQYLRVHGEGPMDRLGNGIHFVGIDEEGLGHCAARAGERRQDEDARLVDLARHVLLGHQIHPVAERSDEGHFRVAIKRRQVLLPPRFLSISRLFFILFPKRCLPEKCSRKCSGWATSRRWKSGR